MNELFPIERSFAPSSSTESVRRLSKKQGAIIEYIRTNGSITLAQATELVGGNVYYNQAKHTGALLSNMVRRSLICRTSPGKFALPQ